ILVRGIVEKGWRHGTARRPRHEPVTDNRVRGSGSQVSDEQVGIIAPETRKASQGGYARQSIVGEGRASRKVPSGSRDGILAVVDEITGNLAVAVVEVRAGEHRNVAPGAADSGSGRRSHSSVGL